MRRVNHRWACALTVLMLLSIVIIPLNNSTPVMGAATATGTAASVFSDVTADNANLPFIVYLSGQGILKGYPDGKFMQENGLTRAEAATVIARAAGLAITPVSKSPFRDVGPAHWAQATIAAVTQAGYLKGYPDGRFLPDVKLTRAEGISLMLRLSKQPVDGVTLPALSDVNNKHWAAPSIAAALSAGMIGLTADNKNFLPDQSMTRAEMARALGVLLTKDPDLSSRTLTGTVTVKKGQVSLLKAGSAAAQTISGTVEIKEGDILSTGSNGEADISFPDGSGFLVKPNSEMDVKAMKGRAYIKSGGTAGTGIGMLEVSLKKGVAFGALATGAENSTTAAVGYERLASLNDNMLAAASTNNTSKWYVASQKPVRVQVDMPWGVCAVRGTFWQNFVNANGSGGTSLLAGHADITSGGQSVALAAGQETTSSGVGAPLSAPAAMSSEIQQEWAQAATWARERAEIIQTNQEVAPVTPSVQPIVNDVVKNIEKALTDVGAAAVTTPTNHNGGDNTITGFGSYELKDAVKIDKSVYGQDEGVLTRSLSVKVSDTQIKYYALFLKQPDENNDTGYYYNQISSITSVGQPIYVLKKLVNNTDKLIVRFYQTNKGDKISDSYYNAMSKSSMSYSNYYVKENDVYYYLPTPVASATLGQNNILSEIVMDRAISGTISLPEGVVAPAGGLELEVYAHENYYNVPILKNLTLAEGQNSVAYSISVPCIYADTYDLECDIINGNTLNLVSTGEVANIDVASGSKANVDFKFTAASGTISGTISLPTGVTAAADLPVFLTASSGSYPYGYFEQEYVIPQGKDKVDFVIGVTTADSVSSNYYYVSCSMDKKLAGANKLMSYVSSQQVDVTAGNSSGIQLQFLAARLIKGTIVLPTTLAFDTYVKVKTLGTTYSYTTVPIAKGTTSAEFSFLVLPASTYSLAYELEDVNALGSTNILSNGYYKSNTEPATSILTMAAGLDLTTQDQTGIVFTLATGNCIQGTISLAEGEKAPIGGAWVDIGATSDIILASGETVSPEVTSGYISGAKLSYESKVFIPENSTSVNYSLAVAPGYSYTMKYRLYDSTTEWEAWDESDEAIPVNTTKVENINGEVTFAWLNSQDIGNDSIVYGACALNLSNNQWSQKAAVYSNYFNNLYFKHQGQWYDLLQTPSLESGTPLTVTNYGVHSYLNTTGDTMMSRYQPYGLNDVCGFASKAYAVGDYGVFGSTNGYDLTTDDTLNAIVYGDSGEYEGWPNLLAVGNSAAVLIGEYGYNYDENEGYDYGYKTYPGNTDGSLTGNLIDASYTGTYYCVLNDQNQIGVSCDGGYTFSDVTTVPTEDTIKSILASNSGVLAVGTNGCIMAYQNSVGSWFTTADTLTSSDLNDVTVRIASGSYGLMFIAVGADGTILKSTNPLTNWTKVTSPVNTTLNKVAWIGDKFMAVGDGGVILISPDGTEWTKLVTDTTINLNGITGMSGKFVAVGDSGIFITSPQLITDLTEPWNELAFKQSYNQVPVEKVHGGYSTKTGARLRSK